MDKCNESSQTSLEESGSFAEEPGYFSFDKGKTTNEDKLLVSSKIDTCFLKGYLLPSIKFMYLKIYDYTILFTEICLRGWCTFVNSYIF